MPEEQKPQHKVNKFKVYAIAILLFVLGNFIFETALALLENQRQTLLYPIIPYTRIYLLISTVLLANYYIRRKQAKPKQKLWWRILKALLMIVLALLFLLGASFSISEAELEQMRQNRPEAQSLPELPSESTMFEVTE